MHFRPSIQPPLGSATAIPGGPINGPLKRRRFFSDTNTQKPLAPRGTLALQSNMDFHFLPLIQALLGSVTALSGGPINGHPSQPLLGSTAASGGPINGPLKRRRFFI